jgi:hypothetical protein
LDFVGFGWLEEPVATVDRGAQKGWSVAISMSKNRLDCCELQNEKEKMWIVTCSFACVFSSEIFFCCTHKLKISELLKASFWRFARAHP